MYSIWKEDNEKLSNSTFILERFKDVDISEIDFNYKILPGCKTIGEAYECFAKIPIYKRGRRAFEDLVRAINSYQFKNATKEEIEILHKNATGGV